MKTIAEVKITGGRVARLLDTGTTLRVVLLDGGREVGAIPLKERSVDAERRAGEAINLVAARLSRGPEEPPPPVERPYSFADKVETLARHIERFDQKSRDAEAERLRARGFTDERIERARGSLRLPEVEEGRDYWYVRRNGSRRYAVDVKTGTVYPVGSKGVLKYQGFGSLDTIGEYDWNDRWYAHRKLAAPLEVEMHRSSLVSPETKVKREPTYALHTADNVPLGEWTAWRTRSEKLQPRGQWHPKGGPYGPAWFGANYDPSMSLADVANAVRRQFAADIADGFLPRGTVFSVTVKDKHITVTLMRMPGVQLVAREWALDPKFEGTRTTESREKVLKYVGSVLDSYNHDKSDIQSDYFDVKFYDTADVSGRLINQQIGDLQALATGGDRVDVYLTRSLEDALKAKKLHDSWKTGPRAVITPGGYRIEWVTWADHPLTARSVTSYTDVETPAQALEVAEGLAREHSGKKPKANHSNAQLAVVGLMGASSVYALGRGMLAERRAKELDASVIAAVARYRPTMDTRIEAPRDGYNGSPTIAELSDGKKLTPGHDARKRAIVSAAAEGSLFVATDPRGVRYLHLPGDPATIEFSQRYSYAR